MMKTRRSFLRLIFGAVSSAPLFVWLMPATPAPGFHMVNGWILTDADLLALRQYGLGGEGDNASSKDIQRL